MFGSPNINEMFYAIMAALAVNAVLLYLILTELL